MLREDVDRWLRAYVEAWKTYDGEQIGRPVLGRRPVPVPPVRRAGAGPGRTRAVVAGRGLRPRHLGSRYLGFRCLGPDKPGTYDAAYRAVAVDGDVAVATGTSTYICPARVGRWRRSSTTAS